jgi:competence protein ComEC
MSALILPLRRPGSDDLVPPPSRLAAWGQRALATLRAESDRFILWMPAFLGLGIALFFALPAPPPPLAALTGIGVLVAAVGVLPRPWRAGLTWPVSAMAAGFLAAGLRTELVAAPIVSRDLGPRQVEGTVRWFEPLEAPGRLRLVLDHPSVRGLAPSATPKRIRLRLAGTQAEPAVGDHIRLTATLGPPPGEVAPGGYDFARVAWYEGIGAVGFGGGNFSVVIPAARAESGVGRRFAQARTAIQDRIRRVLAPRPAAFATALITGARGAMPHDDVLAFQNSGLAHVLSISGVHLALVAGLVMALVRGGLALIEPIALAWPVKKIAAIIALAVAAIYIGLSGGDVAALRSFVMLGVGIGAILIDRPALNLRALAFAAILLLMLTPEVLFNPSFQMSFGAVAALLAGYEWIHERRRTSQVERAVWRRSLRFILGVLAGTLISTVLAEAATAPFAAYHFNQLVVGGLIANEIVLPILGLYVMPLAILAVLAMPFGLEEGPLRLLGWGLEQLLGAAHWVAGLPFSVTHIEVLPGYALIFIVAGCLWLALWRTGLRVLGVAAVALGLVLALIAPAPDLFADEHGAFAFRLREGHDWRYGVVGTRAHSFKAEAWVRRLGGNPADTPEAAKLMQCDALGCLVPVGRGSRLSLVRDGRALADECRRATAILSLVTVPWSCTAPNLVLDIGFLKRQGPVAVRFANSGPRLQHSALRAGWPWRKAQRPPRLPDADEDDPSASEVSVDANADQ